ncbi:hypothetical protein AAY473_000095 [Plecturocebus cupreus]
MRGRRPRMDIDHLLSAGSLEVHFSLLSQHVGRIPFAAPLLRAADCACNFVLLTTCHLCPDVNPLGPCPRPFR